MTQAERDLKRALKLARAECKAWRDYNDRRKQGHNDGAAKVEKAMEAHDDAIPEWEDAA